MKNIIGDLISGKVFGKVKELIDEVVTTKEEKMTLHIKLRELEMLHAQSMADSQITDVLSAREREVEALKSGGLNLTQNMLAYIAIVAFFVMTGYILANGLLRRVDLETGAETFEVWFKLNNRNRISKDVHLIPTDGTLAPGLTVMDLKNKRVSN